MALSKEQLAEEISKLREDLKKYRPGQDSEGDCGQEEVKFPDKLCIGLFGRTGCGKTSLINSLKCAVLGTFPRHKWIHVANNERAGGQTRQRRLIHLINRIYVIDNRGLDDLTKDETLKELEAQIDGKRGYSENVQWSNNDHENNVDVGNNKNSISCVVFVFSARDDIIQSTKGLFKVVDSLQMHQGKYPVAVITKVDCDDNVQRVEALRANLQVTGISAIFEVANVTKNKTKLEASYQHNLLSLLDRCRTDGDETAVFKHYWQKNDRMEKQVSGSNQEDISFGGLSAPPEILARGPRARRAYAEAAQAGTKKVFRTRLMLVGQERVGKTSLKKTLTGQGFDQNEAITDGVETTHANEICIEVAMAGGKIWSIHKKGHGNEDKNEDKYNKALANEIAKKLIAPQDQEGFEPHSDTSDIRGMSPEKAAPSKEIAQKLTVTTHQDSNPGSGLNPVEAGLVLKNDEAHKVKKKDDKMTNQMASLVEKMLKEQVRLKKIGTDRTDSDKGEGVSLSIWDFAGQDIYYTTHQVFLTWRAIYVIVFDLSRSLDSVVPPQFRDEYYEMAKGGAKSELTCLEFINFWLCSIYAHAVAPSSVRSKNTSKTAQKSPPIFIVGTHRESVKGDAKENKKKKIHSAFEKIRKSTMKRPFECHVVPKYYAIENSLEDKDEELVALRRHIEQVAMKEPYMGEEIPIRWLLFEEALAADKINYMSLDQVKELTQLVGIKSERELLMMLTFYHDQGYVVYYGGIEDQQSLLRDMVILNPQWLIDVFKQVITILDPAKRDGIMSDAWTTLEKEGILEGRLIQHMWRGFLEQKEALVQLMAKFDLICGAPVKRLQQEQRDGIDAEVPNETEKVLKERYYVPSRLTTHCSSEEMSQIKSSTELYVDFRGFLPDGLFHRLMTRTVRWKGERNGEPVFLFYRMISVMVDEEHHALLEMLPPPEATIKLTVFQAVVADSDDDSHQPPAPSAVRKVMDFVTETLDSLIKHWARRIEYDVCFMCPTCSKKKLLKNCFEGMSLQCGLHYIRTAAIKFKFGITETSLGNTKSISPRASASTIVDNPHPGASSSVGEGSTSTARKVSDAMLNKLARQIPSDYYGTFCEKISIPHNQARTILEGYCNNYAKATRDCMAIWMNKSTRTVADLHGVLRAAELGGLIVYCN